jgi:hypothetical protein
MVEIQSLKVKYKEPLLMFENVNGTYKNVSAISGSAFSKDWPGARSFGWRLRQRRRSRRADHQQRRRSCFVEERRWKSEQLGWFESGGDEEQSDGCRRHITWEAGGVKYRRLKTAGGSYLSSHDPREILGIGKATKIDSIEIKWPSGLVDKLTNPIRKYIKVEEH